MAGGTFNIMDKIRPGAYFKFESVPRPLSNIGSRGVVTFAAPMSWGKEGVTELYSSDLLDGKSLGKIGLTAYDPESLPFRLALSGAYLAYVYRLNTGAVKAVVTEGNLTAVAKYPGITGNKLEIVIISNGAAFDVLTYFGGAEVSRVTAVSVDELDGDGNDWVEFSGSGTLGETAGAPLTGGSDGMTGTNLTTYFNEIKGYKLWNTMAVLGTGNNGALVKAFIKQLREDTGRFVQAVMHDYPDADYEGIISVDQGYKTAYEEITKELFPVYIAGLTAGAAVNGTNTGYVIPGAVSITGEKDDEEIPELLRRGMFILSRRQDGAIVIEKDINTFTSFSPKKNQEWSKNRVLRTMDGYANDIRKLWEGSYVGKVDNNDSGRDIFKADVINYLQQYEAMSAIQNFDPGRDISVLPGPAIDDVILDSYMQPVDSVEKLYNRVYVRGSEGGAM